MLEDEAERIVRGDGDGHWSGMIDLEVGKGVPENIRSNSGKTKKLQIYQ